MDKEMKAAGQINEANELLMQYRISAAKGTVLTEENLYKVQMLLYKALDNTQPLPDAETERMAALGNTSEARGEELLNIIETCLQEAPVDFVGTGGGLQCEKEEKLWYKTWREAVAKLREWLSTTPKGESVKEVVPVEAERLEGVEWIVQEFKELNIYLDDIYQQGATGEPKDAGNLWIAFTDKFNAFKKRLLAGAGGVSEGEAVKEIGSYSANEIIEMYKKQATTLPASGPSEEEIEKMANEETRKYLPGCAENIMAFITHKRFWIMAFKAALNKTNSNGKDF